MQPRILVVDDETIARKNTCMLLRQARFEVVEASDGKDAVALLSRAKVDLVITDIRMPRVNGLLLREIISSTFPETAVLLMTAYYPEFKDKLESDHFLLKPIVFEELLAKAQKLLEEGGKNR